MQEILQQMKFQASILRTIRTTLPVIVQNYCTTNNLGGPEDSMLGGDMPIAPSLSLCELLFPAFNSIVPQFYESVLPYLDKAKSQADVEVLLSVFHSAVGFAFKTQIFDKLIWKKVNKLLNQGTKDGMGSDLPLINQLDQVDDDE